jgi:arsenical pump membrane protein
VSSAHIATWAIAAASVAGVITRPRRLPEALWAVLGAGALVVFSLISLTDAVAAVSQGTDVYLFLVGMMLLAEIAREQGVFDWLAGYAVSHARGSPARLFLLVYGVGTIVSILLSNDATAVVLTPAVYVAARRARVAPLPYLYVCAFIANAASFVLPISNPANLVVYGHHMPSLSSWLARFALPSIAAIVVTFVALRLALRAQLTGVVSADRGHSGLGRGGRIAAASIGLMAVGLLTASARGWPLGLPTFLAGSFAAGLIWLLEGASPLPALRQLSWSILPLVGGLFVLVRGVGQTGLLDPLGPLLQTDSAARGAALAVGSIAAIACNLLNNLPLGLIAGALTGAGHLPASMTAAALIGVDLGPNLSVTGSLATILWLLVLRREGEHVSAWTFLALGCVVMPPALAASLVSLLWEVAS